MLRERFLPLDYEQVMFQKLQNCRQGTKFIHEYTAEFQRFTELTELQESAILKASRYYEGLKQRIKDKILEIRIVVETICRILCFKLSRIIKNDRFNVVIGL